MDQLISFSSQFPPIKQIFKLVQAATLLKSPLNSQVYDKAFELAEKYNIKRIYRYIESTAQDFKALNKNFNPNHYEKDFIYQQQIEKIDKDLVLYKNQSNKLSTGLSYIEQANLYLKGGDITNANRTYEKTHNYYESGDKLNYTPQWSACMLIERRYDSLKNIYPKEQMRNEREKREQQTQLLVFQALRCLYQGDIGSFIDILIKEVQSEYVIENEILSLVTSLSEIGLYLTMSLLMKNDKKQLQEILKIETIRFFLTQDSIYLETIEAFINLDFTVLLTRFKQMCTSYEPDFIFKRFNFQDIIFDKIFKLYVQPYNKISVNKIIQTFQFNEETGTEFVKKHIRSRSINFLYDPIDNILVQRVTEETKKYDTYVKAVNTIRKFLQKKQVAMLKYQLNSVIWNNSSKNERNNYENSPHGGQFGSLMEEIQFNLMGGK